MVLWLLKSPITIGGRFPCPSAGSTISRLAVCTRNVQLLEASQLKSVVILLPYRYTFQLQVTSDENSGTILDVGLLSYECHSSYLRPC